MEEVSGGTLQVDNAFVGGIIIQVCLWMCNGCNTVIHFRQLVHCIFDEYDQIFAFYMFALLEDELLLL